MKGLKFIIAGVLFGIVMSKSEAISWYRIQEMFRFQSFHMYGIIGTAVAIGVISIFLIKKYQLKDIEGKVIMIPDKEKGWKKGIFGGTIFGMGWAVTGACPGPMFVNLGQGYLAFLLIIVGATIGTYSYGIFKDKLPH
ncbi:MAG: hypothetical protein RLZ47_684 [Bacteroidota bacterium]|jgi:uncharacterized membrane protein YedE/YeeE